MICKSSIILYPLFCKPTNAITEPVRESQWKSHCLVVLGLAVLVGIAFSNSFQSGFVLDNEFIIQDDPRLRAADWKNLWLVFTQDYWYPRGVGGLFRPLTTLSFLVEYSLFGYGENPTHYHWTNLLLHLLNATLVYFLMLRLTEKWGVASGAAGLFAVHPVTTESVTNLIGRSDLLAAASVLGGTLLYSKSTDETNSRRWIWLVLLMLTTAVGILSKENAVIVIAILPLYDLAYRMRANSMSIGNIFRSFSGWFLKGYIALVPVIVGFFLIRYWMLKSHGPSMLAWADNPMRAMDFWSARLTAIKIIGYELGILLFPLHLSCDYSFNAIPISSWRMTGFEDAKAIVALVILISLGFCVWVRYRRGGRVALFLAGWFFFALLPTANLLFHIDSMMAERFLYLPLVAFVGLFSLVLHALGSRVHRYAFITSLVILIGILGFRTHLRNENWQSNLTLWTSAARVCPQSFRVQRSLAWAMYKQDVEQADLDTIIEVAQKAVAIVRPLPIEQGDEKSHLFLGMFYGLKADKQSPRDANGFIVLTDESRKSFEQSIVELECAQAIGEAHDARRVKALIAVGQSEDELDVTGPKSVYENLWVTYTRLGRHTDAATTLQKIHAITPLSPVVYQSLPDELILSGKMQEAKVVILQALLLGMESKVALQQLTTIYASEQAQSNLPIVPDGQTLRLDLTNPLVRADIDAAFSQLIELLLRDRDFVSAEKVREASKGYACDPAPLNALFERLGPKNKK